MKKILISILTLLLVLPCFAREWSLASPDGALEITITDKLSYSVNYRGTHLYGGTASLTLVGEQTFSSVRAPKSAKVDELIPSPFYRATAIRDCYNSLIFIAAKDWKVEFRAYNDGLAYHWVYTGQNPVNVKEESINYTFVEDARTIVSYIRFDRCKDKESQFFNSFENEYEEADLSRLNPQRMSFLPVVVKPSDRVRVLFSESDLAGYPGMYLLGGNGTTLKGVQACKPKKEHVGGYLDIQKIVDEREDFIATLDGPRGLPWRIAVIGDDLTLASSQLTYQLASPCRIEDTSWIKPGKVAWDWWNYWNIKGVDFEAGVNNETYKYYIDFASKNGIEYVIMDDGWSCPGCGNLFDIVPEIDMPGIVKYAEERGVGIILWAGYVPFDKDLEEVCRHYSEMGVKGFKVDFMDSNDAHETAFLDRAAETAARYHLVLDFHGSHIPAGINRKWPNVLNTEGVNGLERLKGYDIRLDQVRYDTQIPFIRQVGGPMDYTQGAMRNGTRESYHPSNTQPMSQGTRCHQLGLYAVLDSPLNMLCDSPTNYESEQECTDYIADIPTVWDETRVLDGVIGEFIVTARRKGGDWYIGGITNWTARDVTVDLSFLSPDAQYEADWYLDGVNAHRDATDYKRVKEVPSSARIVHMAPGGGFAAKISLK
ncbi:glycoside hydrolase family 97 protein [Bacteroides sp. f07]|uniref:glycoside hydrolase family 97 protein n=1 Tax=Bacteroides sp. f07 TaxID=3132704 RepID=UPI0034B8CFEC